MDTSAFRSLSYGMYIVCAPRDGRAPAGCVVNTFAQVTSAPARASVAINKDNATCAAVRQAGRFTVAVLDETAPMELVGAFGFRSSEDIDKFDGVATGVDGAGVPYVVEHACARFSVKVETTLDVGSHVLFVGSIEEAQALCAEPPMTYAYYHEVKGGKTPPKASSYIAEEPSAPAAASESATPAAKRVGWRCTLCGHVEWVDELPDDFVCPLCGAAKDLFERIEE